MNVQTKEQLLDLLRRNAPKLRGYGVARFGLFGSFARGEAREDSDLDLLIEAGPQTPPWFPGGLLVDLN